MEMVSAGLRAAAFLLAIFATLVAAQLYNLVRAGEIGRTWRPFILAALVLGVWSLASFANTFFGFLFESGRVIALVMDLLQTVFVLLFAVGLWQHRESFYHPGRYRPPGDASDDEAAVQAGRESPGKGLGDA